MEKKKIKWEVTLGPTWEWLSQDTKTRISQDQNGSELTGIIELPANENYWYPCVQLILQDVTFGDAMLRCSSKDGTFYVQVQTVALDNWVATGEKDTQVSSISPEGGISLKAEFI